MPWPQPDLDNGEGVILTVGFISGPDRWEIVLPCATDSPPEDFYAMCRDCVEAFIENMLDDTLDMLSEDTSVIFVQAEAMSNDTLTVPYRYDYPIGAHVGTRGPGLLATGVGLLTVYYGDPSQTLSTSNTRVGKNTLAGLCVADVVQDIVDEEVVALAQQWAQDLAQGFRKDTSATYWYRVGAALREGSGALLKVVSVVARNYVASQRRRMTPRGG